MTWMLPLLALFGACLHLYVDKTPRTRCRVVEIFLVYALVFLAGLAGLWAFIGHTFAADQVATKIGWPTGNPFQYEVAATNLSYAILGLLTIQFRGLFPVATGIGYSIFLLGAACVHIRDMHLHGNLAELNSGAFLMVQDILVPLVILGLALASLVLTKSEKPSASM